MLNFEANDKTENLFYLSLLQMSLLERPKVPNAKTVLLFTTKFSPSKIPSRQTVPICLSSKNCTFLLQISVLERPKVPNTKTVLLFTAKFCLSKIPPRQTVPICLSSQNRASC